MYNTCLFCHSALGANEVIEHFPVGRRLAFDAERGRLWVVCPKCERWNLSPFETRWEAIEEAERQYRNTRRRVATDNIVLARLNEGLELVRIGRPLRPEFAAWRYGDQFGKRRRKMWGYGAVGVSAVGGIMIAGPAVGLSVGAFTQVLNFGNMGYHWALPIARVRDANGQDLRLSRWDLFKATLALPRGADAVLHLEHRDYRQTSRLLSRIGVSRLPSGRKGTATLTGEHAHRALGDLLPALNRAGGTERTVEAAVRVVEESRSVADVLRITQAAKRRSSMDVMMWTGENAKKDALISYTTPMRLALEMALHEEDERRAMSGELGALYARWEEAERIAHIADSELTPLEIQGAS